MPVPVRAEGLLVARVVRFFSYHDDFFDITVPCARQLVPSFLRVVME